MQSKHTIILFGGSFDPIHNGLLAVAAYAFERLEARRLIFVPARRSPHKGAGPRADGASRLAMIRLAIAGREGFEVSDCELHRAEPSYTLDTVRHFREQVGNDVEIFWLVGVDAGADLDKWYHIDELQDMCGFASCTAAECPGRIWDGSFGLSVPSGCVNLRMISSRPP
jgi:nicotinate-nucleotide adenylyltransferase